jgi:hypothetical protein
MRMSFDVALQQPAHVEGKAWMAALRSQAYALPLLGVCRGGQLGLLQSSTPFHLLQSMQNIFYLYTP